MEVNHHGLSTSGGGGCRVDWSLCRYDTGEFSISPGGINHPGEVVPPHIYKATQPLTGGPGEYLRGLRHAISAGEPVPYVETSPHPRTPI